MYCINIKNLLTTTLKLLLVALTVTHFQILKASSEYNEDDDHNHQHEHNHDMDHTKLGRNYLFGINGYEINFDKARSHFTISAKDGNSTAQLYLGFLYSAGLGVKNSQAKAVLYYTFAAASDNLFAKMALGYRRWAGISVQYDCELALNFYREIAKKVEEEYTFSGTYITQRIRLNDEYENPSSSLHSTIVDNEIVQYFQLKAEGGDAQAQVGLGQLYYQGFRGVEQNHIKALKYFQRAAEAGNANAFGILGKIYLNGSHTIPQNYELAKEYFSRAAKKENPVGQSGLGIMYLHGKGVPQNLELAKKYFKQAANLKWVDGYLQLGIMYHKGLGVEQDHRKALKYFEWAGQQGHILAYYNLAQMHATGTGTMRDCRVAVELFKSVAERGHWAEIFMQAFLDHRDGNYEAAFVKYAFLSEIGYEVAQSNVAFILDKNSLNNWFSQNESYRRAISYLSESSSQGYVQSLIKLGNYYYYGYGTDVDLETAVYYYRKASEAGNAEAFFNLGYMHEQGIGLRKDIHLAHRHYDFALQKHEDAQVPIFFVKIKLFVISLWERLDPSLLIGENWDYYVGTFVVLVLGILYINRRHQQQQAHHNNNALHR